MKKGMLMLAVAVFAASCGNKVPRMEGVVKPGVADASRVDAVVKVSYATTPHTTGVDWSHAEQEARKTCQAWGFEDARRFGDELRSCPFPSLFTEKCYFWVIETAYQCLGDPKE